MTIGTSSIDVAPDLRLTRAVELTLFALCVAQAVFLLASFAQGLWLMAPGSLKKFTLKSCSTVPTDFLPGSCGTPWMTTPR